MKFGEFWRYYLAEHSRPTTRRVHFLATLVWLALLAAALLTRHWWLLAAVPLAAYGPAWFSHFFIERNHPATFRHPLLSFLAEHKMAWLMLTGRMKAELERLGIRPPP